MNNDIYNKYKKSQNKFKALPKSTQIAKKLKEVGLVTPDRAMADLAKELAKTVPKRIHSAKKKL